MGLQPTNGKEDADVAQALLPAEPRLVSASGGHRQECRCSTQKCVRHVGVFNGVTMGPRPTKGDEDAMGGRQSCLQPPFRRLVCKVSRLKAGCSQDWLPHNVASVFNGALPRNLSGPIYSASPYPPPPGDSTRTTSPAFTSNRALPGIAIARLPFNSVVFPAAPASPPASP